MTPYKVYPSLCVPGHPQTREPMQKYTHWRSTSPDYLEYMEMWGRNHASHVHVLCGTNDLYSIDVDVKNAPDHCRIFMSRIKDMISGCMLEQTTSGGYHIWFRSKEPLRSLNVAYIKNGEKYNPFIELKGSASLCRIYGSPGISILSGSIENIPYIDNLQEIIEQGESLNEKEIVQYEPIKKMDRIEGIESPGDDYSSNASVEEILSLFESSDWKVVKRNASRVLLRRPGAKSLNHDADILISKRVFKCYSSSVSEFTDKAYSFFAVYAILVHHGDYSAAARALRADGYGTEGFTPPVPNADIDKTDDSLEKYRITLANKPAKQSFSLIYKDNTSLVNRFGKDRKYGIAIRSSMGLVSGPQKSRKTTILTSMAASAIDGKFHAGFKMTNEGDFVWIDTEQPLEWAYLTAARICIQAGVSDLPSGYYFYGLRGAKGAKGKFDLINKIIAAHPNMTTFIIDGFKDILKNYNDIQEVDEKLSWIEDVTQGDNRRCHVITVMHVNRGEGGTRGHAGSEWEKKCDWHIRVVPNDDGTSECVFKDVRGAERPDAFVFEALRGNIPHRLLDDKPVYDYSIGALDLYEEVDDIPDDVIINTTGNRHEPDLPF